MLAKNLCGDAYFNVIGVDLKNEPAGACWPASATGQTDCPPGLNWQRVASEFGNAVLRRCPQWLIFVQGIYQQDQTIEFEEREYFYNDGRGASLQNSFANPVTFADFPSVSKVVYAPHFYSPSVYPASYYFLSSDVDRNIFEEFPLTAEGNASLQAQMYAVMEAAFGTTLTNSAVVLGEFGGIYGMEEIAASRTSTRVIENFLTFIQENGMAGGFVWSINPDITYDFNGIFNPINGFKYGLFEFDYQNFHPDYAATLQLGLDGTGPLPCFERT